MSLKDNLNNLKVFRQSILEDKGASIYLNKGGIPAIRGGIGGHFVRGDGQNNTSPSLSEAEIDTIVDKIVNKINRVNNQSSQDDLLKKMEQLINSKSVVAEYAKPGTISTHQEEEPVVFISSKKVTSNFDSMGDKSVSEIDEKGLNVLFNILK